MSKQQDLIGKAGQNIARSVLHGLGLEFIEQIGTPVKLVPYRQSMRRDVYQVIWGERVAGDHRAMLPDGRSVLIEVKTIRDRNLQWSDLRQHQPDKLQEHANWNGLSLLVWVHDHGVFVMRWPIEGFGPGKGIAPHKALIHHHETVQYISGCLYEIRKDLRSLELSQLTEEG